MSLGYETHQKILEEFVKKTDKPILELGAGDASTRQIHEWTTNYILTVDDKQAWLDKYIDLKCERHKFEILDKHSIYDYGALDWGVVFVDLSTQEQRKVAIEEYRFADYLVIHDGNYMFRDSFTREEFSQLFKYWKEFDELFPTTVVASNKYPI